MHTVFGLRDCRGAAVIVALLSLTACHKATEASNESGADMVMAEPASYSPADIAAIQATKDYVCPGCTIPITPGTAHLVTWRADGVLGDAHDLAARRHWHTHCWRIS